ncbi:thioredoxin domain-containing protein [Nanoarchaeota archaeon]
MKKIFFVFAVIIVLFMTACSTVPDSNGPVDDGGDYAETLAKCLTENNVKMYGAEWCGHCKNQKEEFGSDFEFVDYVDCDLNQAACATAGIEYFPTWIIDGELLVGGKSLSQLASLSGCQ